MNHPSIVTIHEINADDGVDFIVMEYIEGQTLDELIPSKGMRASQALKCAVQIAETLRTLSLLYLSSALSASLR